MKCYENTTNDYFYFANSIEDLKAAIAGTDLEGDSYFTETRGDANIDAYLDDDNFKNKDKVTLLDRDFVLENIEELAPDVYAIHGDFVRVEMFSI